jgi:hypothetical protein
MNSLQGPLVTVARTTQPPNCMIALSPTTPHPTVAHTRYAALDIAKCRALTDEGIIAGGMIPKVQWLCGCGVGLFNEGSITTRCFPAARPPGVRSCVLTLSAAPGARCNN